ncbi:MAG: hypothetical protein DCC71_10035 [Proteobacteria bacterium]|nr:MAG: hypothetical protein DCC71_10035 [Pseudomonadota bacterium]
MGRGTHRRVGAGALREPRRAHGVHRRAAPREREAGLPRPAPGGRRRLPDPARHPARGPRARRRGAALLRPAVSVVVAGAARARPGARVPVHAARRERARHDREDVPVRRRPRGRVGAERGTEDRGRGRARGGAAGAARRGSAAGAAARAGRRRAGRAHRPARRRARDRRRSRRGAAPGDAHLPGARRRRAAGAGRAPARRRRHEAGDGARGRGAARDPGAARGAAGALRPRRLRARPRARRRQRRAAARPAPAGRDARADRLSPSGVGAGRGDAVREALRTQPAAAQRLRRRHRPRAGVRAAAPAAAREDARPHLPRPRGVRGRAERDGAALHRSAARARAGPARGAARGGRARGGARRRLRRRAAARRRRRGGVGARGAGRPGAPRPRGDLRRAARPRARPRDREGVRRGLRDHARRAARSRRRAAGERDRSPTARRAAHRDRAHRAGLRRLRREGRSGRPLLRAVRSQAARRAGARVNRAVEPVVAATGLEKRFGPIVALADLDLAVERGAVQAVLGPNGAGKSTLLRILAGLARPTRGDVRYAGGADRRHARRLVGYIGHATFLYPALTARENLRFAARLYGVAEEPARTRELLAELDLEAVADRPAGSFSRGLAQRLAIARALVHDPALVLLDEPFTGLDPVSADRLAARIERLRDAGRALVLVTHDLARAAALADRILLLAGGRAAWSAQARCSAEALEGAYRDALGRPS